MVNVIILEDGKVCQQMSGDYATGAVVTQEDDLHVSGFLTGNCNTRFLPETCYGYVAQVIRGVAKNNLTAAYQLQKVVEYLQNEIKDLVDACAKENDDLPEIPEPMNEEESGGNVN